MPNLLTTHVLNVTVSFLYLTKEFKRYKNTSTFGNAGPQWPRGLKQCFSTFVRPRPGKFFFFTRRGPGPNKFIGKYFPNF